MKSFTWLKALALAGALSTTVLVLSSSMWATLGDNAASVLTDQARFKGTLHSVDNQTYVVHEITLAAGGKIREFVTPGGAVFGVAWEGQQPPNLQQLLGPYYQQAQQARQGQAELDSQQAFQNAPRAHRAPPVVNTPGLVVYETGHVRSFHGAAYIPQLIPQGVHTTDIR